MRKLFFFFAQILFRFYWLFWVLNYPNRTELQNPRSKTHIQSSACIWGNERNTTIQIPKWEMSTWTMNQNFSALKHTILHLIWIPLSVPVCFRMFVCDVREVKNEKWEKIFLRQFSPSQTSENEKSLINCLLLLLLWLRWNNFYCICWRHRESSNVWHT